MDGKAVASAAQASGWCLDGATSTWRGGRPRMALNRVWRHWPLALNMALGLLVSGALAAPVLARLGATQAAEAVYAAYHLTCHQWAFRSFFLFGQQPIYSLQGLADR